MVRSVCQVYMLNLVRRWERRERMMNAFDILGVDVKLTVAVDGKYADILLCVLYSRFFNDEAVRV